jgi:hypothetical protein
VTLYVRSPAAFLEDSMLWPPLLPRMLTNPRTVCFCHPVACIISVSVAPLARLIIAITSAFLLLRSEALTPVGWPEAFLADFPALRGGSGFSTAVSLGCPFPASGWMADQTRATAFFRSWNFLPASGRECRSRSLRTGLAANPLKLWRVSVESQSGPGLLRRLGVVPQRWRKP